MKLRPEAVPLVAPAALGGVGFMHLVNGFLADEKHNAIRGAKVDSLFMHNGHWTFQHPKEWGGDEVGLLVMLGSLAAAALYTKLVLKQRVFA